MTSKLNNQIELSDDELNAVVGANILSSWIKALRIKVVPGNENSNSDPNLVKHTQTWVTVYS